MRITKPAGIDINIDNFRFMRYNIREKVADKLCLSCGAERPNPDFPQSAEERRSGLYEKMAKNTIHSIPLGDNIPRYYTLLNHKHKVTAPSFKSGGLLYVD